MIRLLDTNDWVIYKVIRLECIKNTPWAFGARYADEVLKDDQYWYNTLANPLRRIFGFFVNNQIVAMGGLSLPEMKISPYAGKSQPIVRVNNHAIQNSKTMIVSVYCNPMSRGNGYINQLLQHIIVQQHSTHSGDLYLAVEKNNLPAISLYQKLGFVYVEELPSRMMGDGNIHEEILMCLVR